MEKFRKIETEIEGLYIIEPTVFSDERGFFMETYQKESFEEIGIRNIFLQDNHSKSSKGVLRGVHLQKNEASQAKLVRVLKGSVLDVAVDLRRNSPTFGKSISVLLSAENKRMFFIPREFGHGFLTLEDDTEFFYKCDNVYSKKDECGILWNDKELQIDWKLEEYGLEKSELIISEKDKKNITFEEYKNQADDEKVLLLGAKGQLGTEFQKLFNDSKISYVATDISELDITNHIKVREYIFSHQFTKVINCAAYNDVDKAEEEAEKVKLLNTEVVENLTKICSDLEIPFVTYSTDFVFDGRKKFPYNEFDVPNPLSQYGMSKEEGEKKALQYEKSLVIRTSWVYGMANHNFCKQVLSWAKSYSTLKIVDDQVSSPTYAKDLAYFSWKLLQKRKYGLYHFSNTGEASKYTQAEFILSYIGWNGTLERAKTSDFHLKASRPNYSKLDSSRIEREVGEKIPDWRVSLIGFLEEGKELWKK